MGRPPVHKSCVEQALTVPVNVETDPAGVAIATARDESPGARRTYPACHCGHPLWAPTSQKRGYCEGCRIAGCVLITV